MTDDNLSTRRRGRLNVYGFGTDEADTRQKDFVDWDPKESESDGIGRWTFAWQRFKRNRLAVFGLVVIAIMGLVAIFARPIEINIISQSVTVQPFSLAPHPPGETDYGRIDQAPSWAHPFGTDWVGRDQYSRVLIGGRYSLSIGGIAVVLALLVGIPLGALAGYYGGWVDEIIMRMVDVLYAFPFLVLAIAIIAIFGQGFWRLIAALVSVGWISYARLIRGEILSVKENEYVLAAESLVASNRRIIFRHVVPNAIAPVIVQATLNIGTIVLAAAALGFLGLGLEPGSPEWGTMLSESRDTMMQGLWWVTLFPGLALFLFVLAINLVGDGINDALDPQTDTAEHRGR